MSLASLLAIVLKASIALLVFGVGLSTTPRDATYLVHRPGLLARSILAMNVVMPVIVIAITTTFGLPAPVKFALVALSMSTVPPLLPSRTMKAGGTAAYTISLFATASLVAIVSIPITVALLTRYLGIDYDLPEVNIVKVIAATVLVPVIAGMTVRRYAPHAADRIAPVVLRIAPILLIAAVLPLVTSLWPAIRSLMHDGAVVAIVVVAMIALVVGHVLGGPEPHDRTVLALATASRHPAVALAIVGTNFRDTKLLVAAAVLTLVVNAIVTTPYAIWSKRAIPPN